LTLAPEVINVRAPLPTPDDATAQCNGVVPARLHALTFAPSRYKKYTSNHRVIMIHMSDERALPIRVQLKRHDPLSLPTLT
jgi:hypothetical protein